MDPQLLWKGANLRLTEEQIATLKAGEQVDLGDAQLVWRGKDLADWSELVVPAPPIYVQEKIHPKHLVEDIKRQTRQRRDAQDGAFDLFGDFNGLDPDAKTRFYQHDQNWQNRLILGDSLNVMASLAEREALQDKVQCIYFDPPFGIKFNSNWQVSTRNRTVEDGKSDQITREPEQIKAFRDTWKDGIHSYLTYLRDRLTVMRGLLTDSGSIFVQIGHENVHRVRLLLDEVFGDDCLACEIVVRKKGSQKSASISPVNDFILWYTKSPKGFKFRRVFEERQLDYETVNQFSKIELPSGEIINLKDKSSIPRDVDYRLFPKFLKEDFPGGKLLSQGTISNGGHRKNQMHPILLKGKEYYPPKNRCWCHPSRPVDDGLTGMDRVKVSGRLMASDSRLSFKRFYQDFPYKGISNWWDGFGGASNAVYVVQTNERIVERCILMTTDPGDLVLDPTCGSGTTASVAERLGRRWITIDTSRVALALARTRIMSACYPYYYLVDSPDGRAKEQAVYGKISPEIPTCNDIRQGFVYRRATHVTSSQIANNAEIDVIWDKWQDRLEPLREELNRRLGTDWQEEWQVPHAAEADWPAEVQDLHQQYQQACMERQQAMDRSIAQKAEVELLYDRPYEDKSKVRVAGPFTVESLSPHRVIPTEEAADRPCAAPAQDFASLVLNNLKSAGVQQSDKQDRIAFTALDGWPGTWIAARGLYQQDGQDRRAAIFIGPEFGSVTKTHLLDAAREANEVRFDLLIACGFNFDAQASDIAKLGPLPILKARMNPDLHMADDLKNTGKGNLFVVFGEPDIRWEIDTDGNIIVQVLGIDVFDPRTNEVRASGKDDIAAWFIDTDYNEESFFVRQAYFLGANDPYKSLKTSLKAEIDQQAWETLYRDISRPFARPSTNRFAVKVINHFGDEVMKVFTV